MKHLLLLSAFALGVLLSACEPHQIEDIAPPLSVPGIDPLENINNPLRFSDEAYAILSKELTIDQDIFMPRPVVPEHLSDRNTAQLTDNEMRRAVLGRVLFYDTRLSKDGTVSCATCHQREAAFGDKASFSLGLDGHFTDRNSIALGSVAVFATGPAIPSNTNSTGGAGYYAPADPVTPDPSTSFFWDARAPDMNSQSMATIRNPVEMGMDVSELMKRLNALPTYRILAAKAYRTDRLNSGQMIQAIGDFLSTVSTTDTPYDDLKDMERAEATEADIAAAYTASELRGADLFARNCAACHGTRLAKTGVNLANNGLEMNYTDQGNGPVSGKQDRNGVFRTPFLRNVALTAPYMHDGRFATLREVVDHYSEGIVDHPNLHRRLRTADGTPRNLHLSEADKEALIDFLEMMTDRSLLTDGHTTDPFRR